MSQRDSVPTPMRTAGPRSGTNLAWPIPIPSSRKVGPIPRGRLPASPFLLGRGAASATSRAVRPSHRWCRRRVRTATRAGRERPPERSGAGQRRRCPFQTPTPYAVQEIAAARTIPTSGVASVIVVRASLVDVDGDVWATLLATTAAVVSAMGALLSWRSSERTRRLATDAQFRFAWARDQDGSLVAVLDNIGSVIAYSALVEGHDVRGWVHLHGPTDMKPKAYISLTGVTRKDRYVRVTWMTVDGLRRRKKLQMVEPSKRTVRVGRAG